MFSGVNIKPSANESERQTNIRKASVLKHEEKNPCIKEHEQSYKCLDENNYNRDICAGYFENYKKCKEFWSNLRVERRRQGIEPNLPPPEERERIKKEYLEQIKAKRQAN
ncbi:coiled-coil-helix-coiled-coil-helix domain-containing protein 7-like [Penaeus indicus]|uniref:coiled-coil-helix-coiled-coil-helix domain-containing protein 7-like n=1 Tax=Penaeus indicus TaxID=29960 RepID=UPI00300D2E89